MKLKTKTGIGLLLSVYFFSHSFTQWIFGFSTPVYAADEVKQEKIIALFVDKNIYEKHVSDINWYAQEYIQSQNQGTKALVLPINKDNFQAYDIWKILENLYQEGEQGKNSALIGTILIGDIALPVIREENYIYPSIYPYTDLSKPSYVYDNGSTYFVPQEKGDHKAEIWQSVINFQQSDDAYTKFFSKLKTYKQDPGKYTSTKIWYDDFIALKKYFADQFISGYINNALFNEDITYHRYTNLILDYFKDSSNNDALSLIEDYTNTVPNTTDDDYGQLGDAGEEYTTTINKWKKNLNNLMKDAKSDLGELGTQTDKIPTLMLGESILSLTQPYTSLYAPEYLTTILSNAAVGGRWEDGDVDTHMKKTSLKDNLNSPILFDTNKLLEDKLYNTLKEGKYALHIPIPLVYEKYDCLPIPAVPPVGFLPKKLNGRFENFYFGKSAYDINSTQDISIYPGTWRNIGSRQNLTNYNYTTQTEQQDDIAIDYTTRSVGASYGIASRQVEASRGYDTSLISSDLHYYDTKKCNSSQSLEDFVSKYWGGISPLNVDGNTMKLKQNNPKMDWNPRFDTSIGGPVYNIAGSKMTLTKMNENIFFLNELNNSLLHRTQQYRIAPWFVCGQLVPPGEVNENWSNGYPQKNPSEVEYFSRFAGQGAQDHVYVTANNQNTSSHECGNNYVYKTIDTLESHTSPTPDEIKGMSPLTADRPIDSARFVVFKGIAGNALKFDYPNIYNVSVYNRNGDSLTLKSSAEIQESIKTYLKQKVAAINTQLSQENGRATMYYSSHGAAFDTLGGVNSLASPKNRTYTLLPEDFFITTLGDKTIAAIADVLYWQNLGWQNKPASSDVKTDLQNNQAAFDMNKRVGYIVSDYLTKQDNPSVGQVPGYQASGYELVYINSDGNDTIKSSATPTLIENAELQNIQYQQSDVRTDAVNAGLDDVNNSETKKECGIENNDTVALLKWPAALICWIKSLRKLALNGVVKINFKNAQGPVLGLDQFKDTATTWTDSVKNYSNQWKALLGQDTSNNENLSPDNQEVTSSLDETVNVSLNKSAISMDERNDLSLTIGTNRKIGNVSVRISGTGDNCPVIEGRNLCNSEYSFQGDIYTTPRVIPVNLRGTNIGASILNVKVCQSVRCTERQIVIPLVAGAMTKLEITTPSERALSQTQVPFIVLGYDTYGNLIEQGTTSYRLSASTGTIITNNNSSKSIDLQSFDKNTNYYLDLTKTAPDLKDVSINIEPTENIPGTVMPRATKTLSLSAGTLAVKYNKQSAESIDMTLPENIDEYFSATNGVQNLQEGNIPKIIITLTTIDGKALESQGTITTTQGLLIPGTTTQTTYDLSGKPVTAKEFTPESSFSIQGGVATILLYPSFKAGDDTLTIEIPGLPVKHIPIHIHPASPYRVGIQAPDSLSSMESATGSILLYDRWNNAINSTTKVQIQTFGNLLINNSNSGTITTSDKGPTIFPLTSGTGGGKGYIYASLYGQTLANQLPGTKTINVLAPVWNSANMNAMYLLLGGNDWGNKWNYFNRQDELAQKGLASSDKLLAVTTMLINPDHLLPALLRINQNSQIYDAKDAHIKSKDGSVFIDIADKGKIILGSSSSLSLKQGGANETFGDKTLLYTPDQIDSVTTTNTVQNNTIIVNGKVVWALNGAIGGAEIVNTDQYTNGDTIWDVTYQKRHIGTLRLHASIQQGNISVEDTAGVQETWLGGSTNSAKGWIIYDKEASPLTTDTSWGGIEDSRDPDTNTAWRNTFQAASAFAEGNNVGTATVPGASPFLITLGDPLISRQTPNPTVLGTNYDAGIGNTVFTETEKNISETTPFNLDKDGQQDLLVTYNDGSVRVLRNNGSKDPYSDLGSLMIITDGVKKLFAGDADGNGYDDVIIQTQNNKLRVYKNDGGKLEVDGHQLCLDIPGGDNDIKGAHEWFAVDMDKDGAIDIVTNDTAGDIKLFYGGSSSAGDNYISKDKNTCDENWQSRQKAHEKLIKSYGVTLQDGQKIYDNSLIHRQGLVVPPDMNDDTDNPISNDPGLQNLIKGKNSSFSSLDVNKIVNSGLPEMIQYSASPIDTLPSYEPESIADSIAYMPINMLGASSPVNVYKQYSRTTSGPMQNGEKVTVKVTIEAKQSTNFTYLDEIRGPWQIDQAVDGNISSWNAGNLPSSANVDWNISNGYAFMVDNIGLKDGQTVSFSYSLTYISPKLINITLDDINKDTYTDIKTYSTDSCQAGYRSFISQRGKNFPETFIDLKPQVQQTQTDAQNDVKEALNEVETAISSSNATNESGSSQIKNMPGLDQILESWNNDQSLIVNQNINLSFGGEKIDEMTKGIEEKLDKVLKGMCKGFKLDKKGQISSGPPVPFNMAFLSPGTYNIFGCRLMEDKGLPAFFFPGTIYTSAGPIPAPYGQKGPGDGFYWADGGSYPSTVRIYVSPTITMGVGVAVCFGSYGVGAGLPNPLKHVAGNCIVLAKTFGEKKKKVEQPKHDTIPAWQYDLAKGGPCNRVTTDPSKPYTPFTLTTPSTTPTGAPSDNGPSMSPEGTPQSSAIAGGTYAGGLIGFDQDPTSVAVSSPTPGMEQLKGGKPLRLQIQGGDVKGLVKCIVQKWLDNQIRYIINNLTSMSVQIYLPDISTIFKGLDNMSTKKLNTLSSEGENTSTEEEASANTPSSRQNVAQQLFTRGGMKAAGDKISNPFDAIEGMFKDVPLVKINTRNINIQVPFVGQEDIARYKSFLQDWVNRNEKTLQAWNTAAQSAKNGQASEYANVSVKAGQLVRAVKQNMKVLEQYKKFPEDLNKWLSVSQRYLTEVSDTIETFTNSLNGWLQKNARRFDKYVDAMIQMISAIKTWQVLIDFSVNRKTKCGKCRVDNYDYYACTLSLLCVDLPVLPIPPFRIPNIYIDMSHVNLGLDILLPKFNFVPKSIPMPRLPDLPAPPSVNINVDLNIPNLPVLPAPPKLPDLPSFIPNIELNLPSLPPAPRIPKIAPQITAALKVGEFIAKIFCIVKGNIGLIGEKGVKTRIEQMTQRTWTVNPFDSILVTKIKPPLRGFDIQVDTYVNLQLNFNAVYDLLNKFAQQINKQTNKVMNGLVNENIGKINSLSNDVTNTLQEGVDKGNVNANINLQGFTSPQRWELSYDNAEDGRKDLAAQIHSLQVNDTSVTRKASLNKIVALMNTPTEAGVNIAGVNAVRDQAQRIVAESKDKISNIQEKITNDYDSFIQSMQTTLVSDEDESTVLGTSLFTANSNIVKAMSTQENPDKTYLTLNKILMSGFAHALQKHSASDLNMTELTYNQTKNYVAMTKDAIDMGLNELDNGSETSQTPSSENLVAANVVASHDMGEMAMGASSSASAQADLGQYIKGVFVHDTGDNMVNVVNRDDNIDTIQNNQIRTDLNHDNEDDIIMWDQKQIWVKYSHPEKTPTNTIFSRLYITPTFSSPQDIAKAVQKGGRINVAGSTFKIWDNTTAPQGFTIEGQNFDSISASWINNHVDGYLVQLTDKVTNRQDGLVRKNNTKYVLILSSGTNVQGLFLTTDALGGQKRVNDLISDKTIVDIQYYDPTDDSIDMTLSNLDRQRQYMSVAKLSRKTLTKNTWGLEKTSPRSQQEAAGIQLAGDNRGPLPTVTLIRTQTSAVEGQGFALRPIVGNTYTLDIQWNDDGGVKDNSVTYMNGSTQTTQGGHTKLTNVVHGTKDTEIIIISAHDQNNNVANYALNLQRKAADIAITNVAHQTETSSIIDTSISKGLDKGNVAFERKRDGNWTLLTGASRNTTQSLFPLSLNQVQLSGGVFLQNSLSILYNKNGIRIGTIDKKTGEISLDAAYKDAIYVQVTFSTNIPRMLIKDKQTGSVLFAVTLKGKTALNTVVTNENKRKLQKISVDLGQTFSNGTCIADTKTKECHIYISTQGAIWIPDAYKNDFIGTYTYKDNTITITYQDLSGKEVGKTSFIPLPLP